MPIHLSSRCERVATHLFDASRCTHIRNRLISEASDNIPFHENSDSAEMDRIRFAIMKLVSMPNADEDVVFALAKQDWRDLFVAAGFGYSADEHNQWYRELFLNVPE